MNVWVHFQQAVVNLRASKLRSFLAILGILVGTAAVVALISCGQLATEKALEQFKALGTDLMSVSLYQQKVDKEKNHSGGDQFSLEQWRRLPEQVPDILKIAPYSTAYQPINFEGKPVQGVIVGADESLAEVIKIQLEQGHFVSFVESFEHFAVIGHDLAEQFKTVTQDNLVGRQLQLGSSIYTIIGVASPWKENGFFYDDINRAVIIPIAGMSLVQKDSKINNAVMVLKPDTPIDKVTEQLKQTIEVQSPKLSVYPRSAKQIIASMENQGQIFTLLLAVIGGISLLVGGIGVMNVMLVSVSERKKEIGIRKAIGARNREIQALFLVEAMMLALLGGFLGVVSGLILTAIIAYFSHWTFYFYLMPPLAGFAVSVATGVFFGFYPAHRASKLEPIESLRSE